MLDGETVVIDTETMPDASQVLQIGQPLRVAYFELRGISEWNVARRLQHKTLVPEDRHRICQAGFILPDVDEQIAADPRHLISLYAGYEAVLAADRKMVERYVAAHRRRDTYKGLEIAVKGKQEFINEVLYRYAYGYQEPIIGACLVGHQLLFDLTRFITDVMTPEGTL